MTGDFRHMKSRTAGAGIPSPGVGGDQGSLALRAVAILEAVARSAHSLNLSELAEQVRLPRPTVLRIVSMLQRAELLQRLPGSKRYACGSRLNQLALETLLHSPEWGARRAILAALVDEIGETCNVSVLDGDQLFYLDRVESAWPLQMRLSPGSHVPRLVESFF